VSNTEIAGAYLNLKLEWRLTFDSSGTFFVWATANFHWAAMTTGALGPLLFGLGWWDSFATVIFFNALTTSVRESSRT
jgi:hypothetical protein